MEIKFYLCAENKYNVTTHLKWLHTIDDMFQTEFIIKNIPTQIPCILDINTIKRMKKETEILIKECIKDIDFYNMSKISKYSELYCLLDFFENGVLLNSFISVKTFISVEME